MLHSYPSFVLKIIRGQNSAWPPEDPDFSKIFLEKSREDGIQCLLYQWLSQTPEWKTWPTNVCEALKQTAKNDAIVEVWRQQDLTEVVQALRQKNVEPVLLKGAALSLTHYPEAHLRTRGDTDFLVPPGSTDPTTQALQSLGYDSVSRIEGTLINQEQLFRRNSGSGPLCFYDVHYKLLTPLAFAEALSYEEILKGSSKVSLLGTQVSVIGEAHALLHACMHRVAHHYEDPKLIWLYDMHLLLTGKSEQWLEDFYQLAAKKKMRQICGVSFKLCRERFGTVFPEVWLQKFLNPAEKEPSASFLNFKPTTISLFFMNLSSAQGFKMKCQLIREYFFPSPEYLKNKYKISNPAAVPFLYLLRMFTGTARIVRKLTPRSSEKV